MRKSPQKLRRAGLAGLATTALVIGASAYGITSASADATFAFDRVAGPTRYDTSAKASVTYGDTTHAILASGEKGHYPDALTANYLSKSLDAPVLITKKDSTPKPILDRLKASKVTDITIVGGVNAVSAQQEADLMTANYHVTRIQGATRYDTAEAVIEKVGTTSDTAVLATGQNFPDALGAGPLSYGEQFPLAITRPDSLPAQTLAALKSAKVKNVIIAGGTSAVSNAVVGELAENGITPLFRADGANRVDTAAMLANYETANYGFSKTRVNVASGLDALGGVDALGGGPVSGKENRPLLITSKTKDIAGAELLKYLSDNKATLSGTDNHIFGGPDAVSDIVRQQMEGAGGNDAVAPTITKADLTTDAVKTGAINTGDVFTLTFSETVHQKASDTQVYPGDAALISATDSNGDTFQVRCGDSSTVKSGDNITDASCTFAGGGTSGTTVSATLLEDPEDLNAAGDGAFTYPATINAVANVLDSAGNGVDLAHSADLKIG